MSRNKRWPLMRQGSSKRPQAEDQATRPTRPRSVFGNSILGLFRRNVAGSGYVKTDVDDSSLRRCATDQTAQVSAVHRKTSRAIADAMARSLSSDTAGSPTIVAKPSPRRPTHARPNGQRRAEWRATSAESMYGEERMWGPPPARSMEGQAVTLPISSGPRKATTSLTEPSHMNEFGQLLGDDVGPLVSAETSLRRNKTYSARTAHARAMQSHRKSPSITSTARARATCPAPSAAELSKRSSQFIGYWNPAPSHDLTTDVYHLPPPYTSLPAEPGFHLHSLDDEVIERLNDLAMDNQGLTSSTSSPSSLASHSPVSPTALGPAPRSPTRKAATYTSPDTRPTWAVARGWRTGLYTTYDDAHVQINGFPGPLIRQFDTRLEAGEWLASGAAEAQRIPSLRTLAIDEDVIALAKGRPVIDDKDGEIGNLVRRSSSLRRTHVPSFRAQT